METRIETVLAMVTRLIEGLWPANKVASGGLYPKIDIDGPNQGVPLSITWQMPIIYLRLRKKLESSYSRIRRKWAVNVDFWARHVQRDTFRARAGVQSPPSTAND